MKKKNYELEDRKSLKIVNEIIKNLDDKMRIMTEKQQCAF